MNTSEHARADHAWDARWADAEAWPEWQQPDPRVAEFLAERAAAGARSAADIGCGLGRHALLAARAGLATIATDGSQAGLDHLAAAAREAGLTIATHRLSFVEVPVADRTLDAIVCFNVIYHGTREDLHAALAAFTRALAPGGRLYLTLLSKRDALFGEGREVAPDTWIIDGHDEKSHAHHYCDAGDVVTALGPGLAPLSIEEVASARRPGARHWHVVAEALGDQGGKPTTQQVGP